MDLYSVALFFHIAGALLLIAVLAIEGVGLRIGFDTASTNRLLGPISAVLVLIPGLYMVFTKTGWTAWVLVGLVSWVGIAILGAATGVSLMRGRIGRHTAVISWALRIGLATGVVFAMTVKPGLVGSVTAVVVGAAVGLLVGMATASRTQRAVERPSPTR